MLENFQYLKFLETLKSIPQIFPVLRDKKLRNKTGTTLIYYPKFFVHTRKFLEHRINAYEVVRSCEAKQSLDKTICSPPSRENLRCQSLFETMKGSPAKFVDTMRQRCFNGEQWYLLFMHKFFDNRIFLTQWMVPPRNFSALWDEKHFNRK